MEIRVRRTLPEGARVLDAFGAGCAGSIVAVAKTAAESLVRGGKLLACGNGRRATDAQHLGAELLPRCRVERPLLAALALTTDTSALTAIGNDLGLERVFETEWRALARPGDVVVGITTSGTSPNVVRGLRSPRELGCTCVALTGEGGGGLQDVCDPVFQAPGRETPRMQECRSAWIHALCDWIDVTRFPESGR